MKMQKSVLFGVVVIVFFGIVIFTLLSIGKDQPVSDSTGSNLTDPNAKKATGITTMVTPTKDTRITVNGKNVKEGIVELKSGPHDVTISHDGFATENRHVDLKDGQNILIAVILTGATDKTADYYAYNAADGQKAEAISGRQSAAIVDAQMRTLPLIAQLPYAVNSQYTITFGPSVKEPNNLSAVTLHIQYNSEASKQAALNWIRYRGYEPAKLDITYEFIGGIRGGN